MEPTGLLGLANALVHERRWAEAADVLAKLKQKPWPARFQSAPVNLREQIRALEQKVEQGGRRFPSRQSCYYRPRPLRLLAEMGHLA